MNKDAMIVAGVVALGVLWYVKEKAGDLAAAVGPRINPLDERNLAYTSTNSFLGLLAGNDKFDLGYAAYDGVQWVDGKRVAIGGAIGSATYDGVQWVDGKRLGAAEAVAAGVFDAVEAVKDWWK